jgi:hypothetical protein
VVISFSPGIAQGCFDLLEMADRMPLAFVQIPSVFARLGNLPSSRVVESVQALNWLRAGEDGIAMLTPSGARILSLAGYEPRLRQALLDYIDAARPPWIQNATFGRARVLSFAGSEIAQVFVEAGLAHGTEDAVVAFWDAMSARARGQKNIRLTTIGRDGERLTLTHEQDRTGRMPKWVSIDSNEDGYDVLSVAGPTDPSHLSIEVKATTIGLAGSFHLTANEWGRALSFPNHAFHLWDISKPVPRLAVLLREDVEPHVPVNQGTGSWESVEIPFSIFSAKLLPQSDLQYVRPSR